MSVFRWIQVGALSGRGRDCWEPRITRGLSQVTAAATSFRTGAATLITAVAARRTSQSSAGPGLACHKLIGYTVCLLKDLLSLYGSAQTFQFCHHFIDHAGGPGMLSVS